MKLRRTTSIHTVCIKAHQMGVSHTNKVVDIQVTLDSPEKKSVNSKRVLGNTLVLNMFIHLHANGKSYTVKAVKSDQARNINVTLDVKILFFLFLFQKITFVCIFNMFFSTTVIL